MDDEEEEAAHVFVDEATAMWLSVIHLLDSFEKSREVMDGRLFWTQFETAFQRWDDSMPKRAPLLRSESLWYCLFALELLSQISPVAQTQASPLLRECWPLVTRALSLIHFRSGESKELANGWHMLAKRDAYVRLVLQRCCLLTSEWQWTMEGAEVTLARLFDIFNSHKLADLPTEKQHDFPAFLRDFDVDKLSTADVAEGEATRDPGFHLFIRLLGRTGQELRASAADAKEGDRRISRLFSRMTPVRVMPFTRTDVPTSSQRSVLFNHYNVIMLFLYLVPASSPQRLRQIQSFLPAFKDADFVSQVTCIRAMMYVATIFRHHCLDLSPVTRWFGETITVLRREYEELDSTTKQYERRQMQESLQARGGQSAARPDALRMAAIFENAPARQAALRRKEELARLLVVALRSIQHIIRHGDLDGGRARPEGSDQRLLHYSLLSPAWTQQMLEAQMSLEPRIGQEVLRCIQTFLLARIKILQPAQSTTTPANGTGISNQGTASAVHANQPQPPGNEESQDSFADLFEADDDFDFEDPLLARLLDEGDTSTEGDVRNPDRQREASKALALAAAANERTKWNREFADLVKSSISPSLFQLLSNIYHPDRRVEAAATGSVVMSLGVTERLDEIPVDGHADRSNAAATSRTKMNRLLKAAEARQFLELVVDCWAGCAQVLVTNGLREWSSYLGFGNESWKRIDDPIGRRDVGLRFLQNVLSLDPTAVQKREYEVEFLAVWIQTAVARVLSVQDVYTKSLIEAAMGSKNQSTLMYALATQWRAVIVDAQSSPSMAADDVGDTNRTSSLDLDAFTTHRLALLNATYTTLAASLSTNATTMGTAYSILSALLSSLRAYVEDTPVASSKGPSLDYLRFCRTTLSDVESKLGSASVMISLKGEFSAAVQLVTARLAVVERGLKGVDQERPL
uniref:Uncharacterized protein n=2 Tax=Kalmanozyma brasiliensis (strain GHG001) TaxID=1365824 RepID=V5E6R9_KALBG